MKKTLRMTALVGLMSMILGLMALPAAAEDTVIFTGTATVCGDTVFDGNGNAKPTADGCPLKPGQNNGLYLVGQPGGKNTLPGGLRDNPLDTQKWMDRDGNWNITADICEKYNPLADLTPVPCQLDVSGKLSPVAGIGAACGMSQGHDGDGFIRADNGSRADVWDTTWPISAGGSLPIKGNFRVTSDKEKIGGAEKPDSGQFIGIVQAQGGGPCVKSTQFGKAGASKFTVVAVIQMTPGPKKDKTDGPGPLPS